jgi:hypothetical protein
MKMVKKQRRMFLVVLSIAFVLLMVSSVVAQQATQSSGDFGVTAKVVDDSTDTDEHGLGGEPVTPGVIEPVIEEERPRALPLPNLIISPSRQVTNDGSAEYKIIFKDPHVPYVCDGETTCPTLVVIPLELGDVNNDGVVDEADLNYLLDYLYKGGPAPVPYIHPDSAKAQRGDINQDGIVDAGDVVALVNFLQGRGYTIVVYQRYNYKLGFATLTSQGVQGSFEQTEFTLGAGQTFTTTLYVDADKEGSNHFVVSVQEVDGDYSIGANGVLIYTPSAPEETSFFVGKGFILNEAETQGGLIDLTILRKGNDLSGKMTIGGVATFDIEGEVFETSITPSSGGAGGSTEFAGYGLGGELYSQTLVKFDVSHPRAGVIASFSGYLKQLDTFKLLKGTLTDKVGNEWSLTAYGKKQFHVWTPTEQEEDVEVSVDEVMVFSKTASAEAGATTIAESAVSDSGIESGTEVYIRPIEVYRKKILGIFPIGKRVVDIEIIKPGEVVEKTISENSEQVIEGYKVSVGSLADEDKIEMSIQA